MTCAGVRSGSVRTSERERTPAAKTGQQVYPARERAETRATEREKSETTHTAHCSRRDEERERETANTQPHSQLSPACEEASAEKEIHYTHSEHAVPSRSLSPTCMKKPRRRRPLLVTPPPPVNDWGVHALLRRRPRDTTARRTASMASISVRYNLPKSVLNSSRV